MSSLRAVWCDACRLSVMELVQLILVDMSDSSSLKPTFHFASPLHARSDFRGACLAGSTLDRSVLAIWHFARMLALRNWIALGPIRSPDLVLAPRNRGCLSGLEREGASAIHALSTRKGASEISPSRLSLRASHCHRRSALSSPAALQHQKTRAQYAAPAIWGFEVVAGRKI